MADTTKDSEVNWSELKPQLIRMALELGPLVVFYLGFVFGSRIIAAVPGFAAAGFNDPLYPATLLFMVAMLSSLALSWLLLRRIAVMPVVTAIVVLVFGALTFYFHDTTFAKMKPTVINALFGAVLLGGLFFGQSLLRYVFGEVYKLKPAGWTILTLRWGIFFFVLAALNEFVWRGLGDGVWANYKTFVTPVLTIAFAALQLPVLTKYAPDPVKPVEAPEPVDPVP
jgi:intracellular septation protein